MGTVSKQPAPVRLVDLSVCIKMLGIGKHSLVHARMHVSLHAGKSPFQHSNVAEEPMPPRILQDTWSGNHQPLRGLSGQEWTEPHAQRIHPALSSPAEPDQASDLMLS